LASNGKRADKKPTFPRHEIVSELVLGSISTGGAFINVEPKRPSLLEPDSIAVERLVVWFGWIKEYEE
jgi:hypothetical protein